MLLFLRTNTCYSYWLSFVCAPFPFPTRWVERFAHSWYLHTVESGTVALGIEGDLVSHSILGRAVLQVFPFVARSIADHACRPALKPSPSRLHFQHLTARSSRPPRVCFGCNISPSFEQRPTNFEGNTGGASAGGSSSGSGGTGLFSSSSPARNVRGGTSTPGSSGPLSARLRQTASPSPRSPLLAVRPGAVKRPSSGSLPVR